MTDILHACKVTGFAEKEKIRIARLVKKNPECKDQPKLYDVKNKWFCATFLLFVQLGLPSGKHRCLTIFELTSGSGPSKKAQKKPFLDKASTRDITATILQTGGRSARRALQGIVAQTSKIASNDHVEDSDSFHDSETRTLLLNFNGLAAWNANSERLRSLLQMCVQFGDPAVLIKAARENYTNHLNAPYVDTIAPIYVPVVREPRDRKRPLSTPAPSSPAISPIDVSHVLPTSLGIDILDTPSATIPLSNIAAIDIFGELDESGHENDDDDMSCSQDNNY